MRRSTGVCVCLVYHMFLHSMCLHSSSFSVGCGGGGGLMLHVFRSPLDNERPV